MRLRPGEFVLGAAAGVGVAIFVAAADTLGLLPELSWTHQLVVGGGFVLAYAVGRWEERRRARRALSGRERP